MYECMRLSLSLSHTHTHTHTHHARSPLETANGGFKRASALSSPHSPSSALSSSLTAFSKPDGVYGQCLNDAVPAPGILMQHRPLRYTGPLIGKWAAESRLGHRKALGGVQGINLFNIVAASLIYSNDIER